jgi:NYN domain
VDRCALFVDAGYVLTDGAMAAHGTSQREAVSWDYAGLLQFLAGLAVDRTGLPLLRCYWYEATVDGRRTPEHDTLADLPGLTLRLGRMRPGKREGVDTEIHRDLTTLARNRAVSDVLLVSAGDDLAQVIADVQDLGVRVIIVHISVDGNWTVSRPLRQQCDDIVEIQGAQLRPYAELTGGEPARYSEQYAASVYGGRPMSNGHATGVAGGGHPSLPGGPSGAHPAPPAIYTAPVVAEYQQPLAAPMRREQAPEPAAPAVDSAPPEPQARGAHESTGPQSLASQPNRAIIGPPAPPHQPPQAQPQQAQPQQPQSQQPQSQQPQSHQPRSHQPQANHQSPPLYAAPPAPPAPLTPTPAPQAPVAFHEPPVPAPPAAPETPAPQAHPQQVQPPGPGQAPSGSAPPAAPDQRSSAPRSPYEGATSTASFMDPPGGQFSPAPPDQFSGTPTALPSRRAPQAPAQHGSGQHGSQQARAQEPVRGQQAQRPVPAAAGYVPPQTPYGAASRPAASPPAAPPAGGSLDDTVTAAHAEGFDFGESVARDAPALWLEAVLARKPRMPTDLEARLLQGSALPIDSLLHDEVRQALRRGFWDALERSRR